jgi:hypothetical protein
MINTCLSIIKLYKKYVYSSNVFYEPLYSFSHVTLLNCNSNRQEANKGLFARIASHEYIVHISMYSLSQYHLLYKSRKPSLQYEDHILFRPTNAQYINSNVYVVNYLTCNDVFTSSSAGYSISKANKLKC